MNKKVITLFILIIGIVIISFLLKNYQQREVDYTNHKYGFSFEYNKKWKISANVSKIIALQNYAFFQLAKTGCNTDQECLKKSPIYSKFDENIKNFENNWSIENSESIFLSDLDEKEIENIIKDKKTLQQTDLPQNHFVSILLSAGEVTFTEDKTTEKDGKILEKKQIELDFAGNAELFDIRRWTDSGTLNVEIPLRNNNTDEYAKIYKSIQIVTGVPYNSAQEKDFYNLVNSLKLE
jgi:hypothetical protein